MISELLAAFDWRSASVLRRNALVYLRNWRTAFIPPAMEPLIFFVAFGLGLQGYVGAMSYEGTEIGYAEFVAPGLIAYSGFSTPYYESLYAAYVRMFYQKTWDGILATQVELPHLVWGEILWAASRGFMNTAVVSAVLGAFSLAGLVDLQLQWLPLMPLIGMCAGVCFSAFGLIFTALVPSIDHMNYPVFLVGIPLSLLSNTYFPVETGVGWLQTLVELNPIYQLSEASRGMLVLGTAGDHLFRLAAIVIVLSIIFVSLAMRLTRRRVLS